ncbi:MAG: TMEM165/GDT1 family protein [Methanotrichaceae archaeon]|nr:TMEM165/GDT1 family protein [Methanotrichaceae archaeon]
MGGCVIIETLEAILVPMIAVAFAEMGDKTQLSILLISSKTRGYFKLFLGVFFAFLVVDGLAIALGYWITGLLPTWLVGFISGTIFIGFGIMTLANNKEKEEEETRFTNPFVTGFSLIFISEWGDKTQIASALFATKYNPWSVLIGVIIALSLLSIMAIYLGKYISGRIDKKVITKIAGIIFIIIGISFIFSAINFFAIADILSFS